MKKKILSLIMSAVMLAGLMVGCGAPDGASTPNGNSNDSQTAGNGNSNDSQTAGNGSTESTGEITNITIMMPSMGEEPADMQKIVDAMNEITEREIGIHADYIISTGATHAQSVQMKMTSGEPLDIFQAQGIDFTSAVTQNQYMNLDDLMDNYGQDLITAIPEMYLDACKYNGSQYLIPVVRGCADQPIILVREDMALEAGWDMDKLATIQTPEDFEMLLSDVHEKYPDITLFSPVAMSGSGVSISSINGLVNHDSIDLLFDGIGVVTADSTEVFNYYSSEDFAKVCDVVRDWYNKGYIWKEALTSSSSAIDNYLFAGTLFSFAFSSASDYTEPWRQPENFIFANAPTVNIPIGRAVVTTSAIVNNALAIPSTSKNPEAAMRYLNYFYNSPELENLLCHGIEGEHYTLNEEGLVVRTEYGNANYVNSFNMYMGNQYLMLDEEGNEKGFLSDAIDTSVNAVHSMSLGYVPDLTDYNVETVAITNVCSEYLGGLLIGSVDPSQEIPKFLDELNDAGMGTVIEVKQQQLNDFIK